MKIRSIMAVAASVVMAVPTDVIAQNQVETYLDADVVSHYMWRGRDMGGISIQPEVSVKWKGLGLAAEGSVGFDTNDTKELDVTLSYERYGFNVGVKDYWTSGEDENDLYFNYQKRGAHQLEANIGYGCKYGSLQAYTFFWGNDFKINGQQAYSTYLELSVPFKLGGADWTLAVGGTLFESAGYKESEVEHTETGDIIHNKYNFFYAEGPACVMASLRATKTLDLNFVHLPVYVEFHANPYLQTAHLLFGLSITPF
ncbi:MAG: hypothetical protein IJ551_08355 [Prevotella sp.]|nr:hypothetical protein [Prevotella sp.]